MTVFSSFAYYLHLVMQLAIDMKYFLGLYFLLVGMFANLLYILSAEQIAEGINSEGDGHFRAAVT